MCPHNRLAGKKGTLAGAATLPAMEQGAFAVSRRFSMFRRSVCLLTLTALLAGPAAASPLAQAFAPLQVILDVVSSLFSADPPPDKAYPYPVESGLVSEPAKAYPYPIESGLVSEPDKAYPYPIESGLVSEPDKSGPGPIPSG